MFYALKPQKMEKKTMSSEKARTTSTLEIYVSTVIRDNPNNYLSVEVRGVRDVGQGEIIVDEENPEFYTAYVRHRNGRALAIADAADKQEIVEFSRNMVASYADAYGWTFTE